MSGANNEWKLMINDEKITPIWFDNKMTSVNIQLFNIAPSYIVLIVMLWVVKQLSVFVNEVM